MKKTFLRASRHENKSFLHVFNERHVSSFFFLHDGFSTSLLNFLAEIELHAGVSINQKPFFGVCEKASGKSFFENEARVS